MGIGYKINGRIVARGDFDGLLRALEGYGCSVDAAASYFEISADEIDSMLDLNRDGRFNSSDFLKISDGEAGDRFRTLKSILIRHGYDLIAPLSEGIGGDTPTFIVEDRDVMLAAVKRDGMKLEYASDDLKRDRKVVLAAVRSDGGALKHAAAELQADMEVVLAAIEDGGFYRAMPHVDAALRETPLFWFRLATIDLIALDTEYTPEWAETKVWRALVERLHGAGRYFPVEMERSYSDFKRVLAARYNIEHLDRFRKLETLHEVLRTRYSNDPYDHRPVALVVGPKSDHNGAFQSYHLIDSLVSSDKFRLYYFESGSDEDLHTISAHRGLRRRTIHTLIFMGHGDGDSIQMGRDDKKDDDISIHDGGSEELFIDREDFNSDLIFSHDSGIMDLLPRVEKGGEIFLYSCLSGRAEGDKESLVDLFARNVSSGIRVFGMVTATNIDSLRLNGYALSVTYKDMSDSYVAVGQKVDDGFERYAKRR